MFLFLEDISATQKAYRAFCIQLKIVMRSNPFHRLMTLGILFTVLKQNEDSVPRC